MASPVAQQVKNSPAMQETQEPWVWSLGQEDTPEKDMAIHSSILAWKIPWTVADYSSWGHKESDTTEQLRIATTKGQLMFQKEAKNTPWGEDSLFNKQCSGNWKITCERIKLDPYTTPHTKFNWKWIRGLNVQYKAVKLLKENTEQYSLAPVGNCFLIWPQKYK